jgi:hypothetical protein
MTKYFFEQSENTTIQVQTISHENFNRSSNTYFYSRLDWTDIMSQLSPWRSRIEKSVPFFHYLGIITNLVCIFIFSKKNLIKRKSIFFLVILAFSDLMYNLLSVLPNFLTNIRLVQYNIYKINNASCFMYDFGITSFHFYSVLITLLITADRFDHISRPLKLDSKLSDLKLKKRIGLCVFFVALVIALPHGFLMVYDEKENECDARSFFRKTISNTNLTYYQLYFMFVEPILFWLLPGISIMFMNFVVIYKIIKSNEIYSKKFTVTFRTSRRTRGENPVSNGKNVSIRIKNKTVIRTKFKEPRYSSSTECSSEIKSKLRDQSVEKMSIFFNKENNFLDLPIMRQSNSCTRSCLNEIETDSISNRLSECENYETKISRIQPLSESKNAQAMKFSVNQVSHYITIIIVGFYFILSTIPYGIILSFQNNLTLGLNYFLETKNDYLNNPLWITFGIFREWVIIFRILFISNHCFNLFLYLLFNRLFRKTLFDLITYVFRVFQGLYLSKDNTASFL